MPKWPFLSFFLSIKVVQGTNTRVSKAAFIYMQLMLIMQNKLEPQCWTSSLKKLETEATNLCYGSCGIEAGFESNL